MYYLAIRFILFMLMKMCMVCYYYYWKLIKPGVFTENLVPGLMRLQRMPLCKLFHICCYHAVAYSLLVIRTMAVFICPETTVRKGHSPTHTHPHPPLPSHAHMHACTHTCAHTHTHTNSRVGMRGFCVFFLFLYIYCECKSRISMHKYFKMNDVL